jgi:nucleoside-diphosphate-sugar epimerase
MGRIKIAVTGAAGQVGSALVRRMLEFPEFETVAICRNSISAGVVHYLTCARNIRVGSITEMGSAKKLLGDCEVIINCALAMISGDPRKTRYLNKAIIDSFSKLNNLRRLIHMSSVSVYGRNISSNKTSKSTFDNPRPDNDYGRSKLYIERHAKRMCQSKKLDYHILRLGHVIGANMERSKQIIAFAKNPLFCLPFDGEIPSNSIHIERLSAMIIGLLSCSIPSGIYNVADKNETWRKVLDWHTRTLRLPPVKGISRDKTQQLISRYHSRSIRRDIISYLGALPLLNLIYSPAIFDLSFRVLTFIPRSITGYLSSVYKRKKVRNQIATVARQQNRIIAPYFFSEAMPGPYLEFPSGARINYPSEDDISGELRSWYNRISQPRWLPEKVSEYPDNCQDTRHQDLALLQGQRL